MCMLIINERTVAKNDILPFLTHILTKLIILFYSWISHL